MAGGESGTRYRELVDEACAVKLVDDKDDNDKFVG